MQLFNRRYSLSVKNTDNEGSVITTLTQHRIAFEVEQTGSKFVDKMKGTIYNPSQQTVQAFQQGAFVVLEAGYDGALTYGILFKGAVKKVEVTMKGPDLVLDFTALDMPPGHPSSRVDLAAAPGTGLMDILDIILLKFDGVNVDAARRDLQEVAGTTRWGAGKQATSMSSKVFRKGLNLTGKPAELLNRLLRRTNPRIRWSIQDGGLVVAPGGVPVKPNATAIVLGDRTGLIGSPSIGEKGRLTATSLLQPDLRPFRVVTMEGTRSVNGSYRAVKVKHKGDTHSNEWSSTVEAVKV